MNSREQLGYYQRNEIQIQLANGMKVQVPALNVLGAILQVLEPAQRRQVFEICLRTGNSPFMLGHSIQVPKTLPPGYTDGVTTF